MGDLAPPSPALEVLYFRLEGRKIRFPEYWRILGGNLVHFPIAAGARLLGISLDFGAVGRVDRLHVCDPGELPVFAKDAFEPLVSRCQRLGFRSPFFYRAVGIGIAQGFGAALLSGNGCTVSSLITSRAEQKGKVTAETFVVFLSARDDRHFTVTSNGRRKFDPDPDLAVEHLPGASVEDLWRRHEVRVSAGPRTAWTPEEIPALVAKLERRSIDVLAERGVYVLMSPAEVEAMRRRYALAQANSFQTEHLS